MGQDINQLSFNKADFQHFQLTLYQQLEQLRYLLDKPDFGQGEKKMGAELEMYLVDDHGQISLTNQLLLNKLNDNQFQPELNQYNLELNLSPVLQQGTPFSNMRAELREKTGYLEQVAAQDNINIVPVGILPTLRMTHLNSNFMTPLNRYKVLADRLYQDRGEAFKVNINGEEPISVNFNDISAEGANTSFQVHLMVDKHEFANVFNAAQLTQPLVTAIAANSGIFLGNRVWDETRISLFKQSLDIRQRDNMKWQQPTRVNFGFGWLRDDPWELFAQAVALYPPLIPQISMNPEDSLTELNLHMGTIWSWNRPVVSTEGNGHVRIEFRAIPAGPTSIDMLANAAFAIGLAIGLSDKMAEMLAIMPFRFAEYNFYRAAQFGLNADILWPFYHQYKPEEVSIKKVIEHLLPVAKEGLVKIGVDIDEAEQYLTLIQQRLDSGINGATWQKQTQIHLEKSMSKDEACKALVLKYIQQCRTCLPVAEWERPWQ